MGVLHPGGGVRYVRDPHGVRDHRGGGLLRPRARPPHEPAAPPAGRRPDRRLRAARGPGRRAGVGASGHAIPQIERVHAPAYVAAVRRYSADPALAAAWEAGQWGLAAGGDTPAFAGMHEAAAAVCGASMEAALAVWEGRAGQAFVCGGGLHHAMANRAAGFCVYNDTAVAIQALLDAGAERVAYIDIDVHHGDGTQWIFFEEPRVLTCSVHETGRYLFPGTGGIAERGDRRGGGDLDQRPAAALRRRPALPEGDRGGHRPGGARLRARRDRDPGRRRPAPRRPAGAPPGHHARLPAGLPRLHELARDGRRRPLGGAGRGRLHLPGRPAGVDAALRRDARRGARRRHPGVLAERVRGDGSASRCRATCPTTPSPRCPLPERTRADLEGDRVVDEARAFLLA